MNTNTVVAGVVAGVTYSVLRTATAPEKEEEDNNWCHLAVAAVSVAAGLLAARAVDAILS